MQTDIQARLEEICRSTGAFQLEHFGKIASGHIQDKGTNQLVSFVDIESEKMLVHNLEELVPNCRFVTEEETATGTDEAELTWIIDPLDGTTNFLHGVPAFSISVALYKGSEALAGVVYIPVWDEMFSASKGQGATLNGKSIYCSLEADLSKTLIATGFPYYDFKSMKEYLNVLTALMQKTHGLRRMGSAAIDLAYTACGRYDGFFEMGLNAWDVAAGALIVEEAGGRVTDFYNGKDHLYGKTIVAAGSNIHLEFQSLIQSDLKA